MQCLLYWLWCKLLHNSKQVKWVIQVCFTLIGNFYNAFCWVCLFTNCCKKLSCYLMGDTRERTVRRINSHLPFILFPVKTHHPQLVFTHMEKCRDKWSMYSYAADLSPVEDLDFTTVFLLQGTALYILWKDGASNSLLRILWPMVGAQSLFRQLSIPCLFTIAKRMSRGCI